MGMGFLCVSVRVSDFPSGKGEVEEEEDELMTLLSERSMQIRRGKMSSPSPFSPHTLTPTYTHTHTYSPTHKNTHTHTHTNTCTHAHTHTHTHTYICTPPLFHVLELNV